MVPTLWSRVVPDVVAMTTTGDTSDDKNYTHSMKSYVLKYVKVLPYMIYDKGLLSLFQ